MRHALLALAILLFSSINPAVAEVYVSIGIHVPVYPRLERIPGYPVYYAPRLSTNYFFYDGLYWVFDGYDWYVSSWYNGPWQLVDRFEVPVYLLRVPVRYYRHAPVYFQSWRAEAPPRWGEYWGETWVQRRSGWDQWSLRSAPPPAPLPTYQRNYSGSLYPQVSEQVVIQTKNYRYQPREPVVRQRFEQLRAQAPAIQTRESAVREERRQRRIEQRAEERRIERRGENVPPPHAQAKGWPGKGHDRALEGERPAPPAHAEAKGWPGKGHERAQNRERDEDDNDRPGRGKENRGRGHDR